jgi:hypothetical protein
MVIDRFRVKEGPLSCGPWRCHQTSEKEGGTNPNKAKIDFSQEKIIMQKLKAGMHERVKGHVATWAD